MRESDGYFWQEVLDFLLANPVAPGGYYYSTVAELIGKTVAHSQAVGQAMKELGEQGYHWLCAMVVLKPRRKSKS